MVWTELLVGPFLLPYGGTMRRLLEPQRMILLARGDFQAIGGIIALLLIAAYAWFILRNQNKEPQDQSYEQIKPETVYALTAIAAVLVAVLIGGMMLARLMRN